MRGARAAFLAAALLALAAPRARASTEEFSTFGVIAQEEDDESLLDHFLTRPPREWRDEWERSPQAVRTSQGCLTSGQWFIETDLKVRSSFGRRARFGIDLRQSESDVASYDYLDFSFQFPTRFGTTGMTFRPLYDKSRQDFAATWGVGSDTSRVQLQTIFTIEDMFNNLWAFRQARVGEKSEPYTRHPYEPAVRLVLRQPRWRAEAGGRYLTPSVKRLAPVAPDASPRVASLWGTFAYASIEARARGFDWELRGANRQASSTEYSIDADIGRNHDARRSWQVETAVRRAITRAVTTEARWIYLGRDQFVGPPTGPSEFRAADRMLGLETNLALRPELGVRLGVLLDNISIHARGLSRYTYGSRTESRAYVGFAARFGRVRLSAVEGIELDPEPYDVWGVHDKGFVHLQATF